MLLYRTNMVIVQYKFPDVIKLCVDVCAVGRGVTFHADGLEVRDKGVRESPSVDRGEWSRCDETKLCIIVMQRCTERFVRCGRTQN
mmetsp:Transcript_38907/g.93597  ORF Transcript_38907/g.93597 Transcript_38907/m.93597 type:complete len:86 (+) Transcript_38907:337-594(+)